MTTPIKCAKCNRKMKYPITPASYKGKIYCSKISKNKCVVKVWEDDMKTLTKERQKPKGIISRIKKKIGL